MMNVCIYCREAGNLLTEWKKETNDWDDVIKQTVDAARTDKLLQLHNACTGKAYCFCQHKII